MNHAKSIPIIDLSPLWDDSDRGLQIVAKRVFEVYSDIGFGYIINHNIPENIISNGFKAAKTFHSLPLENKMRIKQNNYFRGYVPINSSQLKISTEGKATKPNQLDAFVMAFEVDKNHRDYKDGLYLAGDNQWLYGNPDFKEKMEAYRDHLLKLAHKLVAVFSIALGMPKDSLNEYFKEPTYFLRLQHYPAQPKVIPGDLFGIAPHTDYGFFTIIAQNSIPGLEVRSQDNDWIDVPCIENSFVLNIGDMMKRWSNDIFTSTPHRVVNKSGEERFSIPFFFEPNMHANIDVLPSCITEKQPSKHASVMYGDYLMERIKGNYNIGKGS